MLFRQIFDSDLAQYAYLVGCQRSREAILVDPQRDVDRYLEIAAREGVEIVAVTETHIHADFLSGARELAARDPALRLYLSDEGGADWKYRWPDAEGREWTPLRDGDRIEIGEVELRVQATPGHTPEHLAFLLVDRGAGAEEPMALLAGDFVFVGDLGRPDLLETAAGEIGSQEPSARHLFASASAFLELPDWLQVWPGHGAGSACGKALGAVPTTTVGYERRVSPAFAAVARGERPFVDFILAGQPEPPPYFARMKRQNRDGAPYLGELVLPPELTADALGDRLARREVVVLDGRLDRAAFCSRHLRGALHVPVNRSFPTVAGAYVEPEQEILLLLEPGQLERALRDLVRVGLDRVVGWFAAEGVAALPDALCATLERVRFADLPAGGACGADDALLLDVRGRSEWESGHLAGARHLAHTRLLPELAALPRERTLQVYCASGARAGSAASLLARNGFRVQLVDDDLAAVEPLEAGA